MPTPATPRGGPAQFAWLLAAVLAAAALGRHALGRLFAAAEELAWSERLLPGFDVADGCLLLALLGLALTSLWVAKPPAAATPVAVGLALVAAAGLPSLERKIDRVGRDLFGWYGDRVAAGLECALVLVVAAVVLVVAGRAASDRRWLPFAAVIAAVAVEAWTPRATLVPVACAGFVLGLAATLFMRVRR